MTAIDKTKPTDVMEERKELLAQIAAVMKVKSAVASEWEQLRARRRGIAGARTALIAKDAMLDDGADTTELDRELAQVDSELADDGDLRTRLRALDGRAERLKQQTIDLVLTRRDEYIAAARATAAAERAAADTARAALEDWAAARAVNAGAWGLATVGLALDDAPLPYWGRVSTRRIGECPSTWIETPETLTRTMSNRQFAEPSAVISLVSSYLGAGHELPPGIVPADALQTTVGVYRDAVTGREQHLAADMLAAPAVRARVLPVDGFAELVYVRPS